MVSEWVKFFLAGSLVFIGTAFSIWDPACNSLGRRLHQNVFLYERLRPRPICCIQFRILLWFILRLALFQGLFCINIGWGKLFDPFLGQRQVEFRLIWCVVQIGEVFPYWQFCLRWDSLLNLSPLVPLIEGGDWNKTRTRLKGCVPGRLVVVAFSTVPRCSEKNRDSLLTLEKPQKDTSQGFVFERIARPVHASRSPVNWVFAF